MYFLPAAQRHGQLVPFICVFVFVKTFVLLFLLKTFSLSAYVNISILITFELLGAVQLFMMPLHGCTIDL